MNPTALFRLSLYHARSSLGAMSLVALVVLISALPVLSGLRAAGALSGAVERQTDLVEVRRVLVEPRRLDASPSQSEASVWSLAPSEQVEWAAPLVEIGVRIERPNASDGGPAFVTVESTGVGDPRFEPSRMVQGRGLIADEPSRSIAIISSGLSRELGEDNRLTLVLQRSVSGVSESLSIECEIAGESPMDGRRVFLGLPVVAALDHWSAGGEFNPDADPAPQSRAIIFVRDAASLGSAVRNIEDGGWRTSHRLRDVRALQRTRALIYGVAVLAASGFIVAGLVASVVYVASSRRRHRICAAAMRLSDVRPLYGGAIVLLPLLGAALVGFLCAAVIDLLLTGRIIAELCTSLGIEPVAASAVQAGPLRAAGLFSLAPIVAGLIWSWRGCWRAPLRSAFHPASS